MHRHKIYFFFLLWALTCSFTGSAQEVQWASEVIAYSSQYGTKDYSAQQVLGVPNALGGINLHDMAWVPKRDNNPGGEYIHVGFKKPMPISQIAVAESLNPGSISRIYIYDTQGTKTKVYENKNPQAVFGAFRLFRHKFDLTEFDVASVRIEMDTKAVEGSNQIDAIGISNSRESIKPTINALTEEINTDQIEHLSPAVNSEFAERLPMISPDGKTLYFARKYHPQNIGEENNDDIWVSYRQPDGQWSVAVNIGAPLNNRDHNFVVAFNPSGDMLYLGSDYQSKAKDGVSVSYQRGRSWSNPKSLKIEDHYNKSEFVAYHVSLDGQVLLMAVERDEGYGGLDLYVSFQQSDLSFSRPLNLGATVNTVGSESSVFLAADNKTIYFSSNGHEGFGGYDMFMSRRLDESWQSWTKPENLGNQINSPQNEYNYTIPASGRYAYFSSGDPSGMSDLYRIPLPEKLRPDPVMLISGRIINAESNKPLNADLKLQTLNHASQKPTTNASNDGDFQFVVPYGEDIGVYAESEGYFAISENLALSGQELEELDYDREGILAQNNPEKFFSTDSGNIEQLQLRLSELDEDMQRLTLERQRVKEEYHQQGTLEKEAYRNDPELEALRHKYNNNLRAKKETDQKQYGQNEVDDNVSATGDRELDELKRKFEKHYGETDQADNVTTKTTPASKPKDNKDRSEDASLEEMKRKYQQHYQEDFPNTVEQAQDTRTSTTPDGIQPDFDLLETLVRRQLRAELLPAIHADLRHSLITKELRSLEKMLNSDEREQLEQAGFTNTLRQRVLDNPLPEIKAVNDPLLHDPQWKSMVIDLKRTMREDIRNELSRELTPLVRNELRNELTYEIKKATELRIQKELQEKLEAQPEVTQNNYEENLPNPIRAEAPSTPFQAEYREVKQDILLLPIKVGQIIPMNNLFFDSNQATIKENSTTELQRVYDFLQKNPKLVVEIGGHTNGWCSHVFANELSQKRSQTVAEYLIQQGIPPSRIQYRGYGKTKAIDTNDTVEGRKKNQRVELTILEVLE